MRGPKTSHEDRRLSWAGNGSKGRDRCLLIVKDSHRVEAINCSPWAVLHKKTGRGSGLEFRVRRDVSSQAVGALSLEESVYVRFQVEDLLAQSRFFLLTIVLPMGFSAEQVYYGFSETKE